VPARSARAAGSGINKHKPVIFRWNGRVRTRAAVPGAGGLDSVTAVPVRSARAAGFGVAGRGSKPDRLILHWNGRARTRAAVPGAGYFYGVTALSASSARAVGATSPVTTTTRPVIMHWNGVTWKNVPGPAGGGALLAVAASSARSAWAVGSAYQAHASHPVKTLIVHWNGARWT
jgi:hypothetical protein